MKHIKLTMALGLLLSIFGCQSTSDEPKKISETNQQVLEGGAYAAFQRIESEYEAWLTTLQNAKELKVYSASKYKVLLKEWGGAVDIYEEAASDPSEVTKSASMFSSVTNAEAFDQHLLLVKESYEQILQLKVIADDVLADAIAQKRYLDEIGAKELYPGDYKKLVSKYGALFKEVELGELDDAQSKQVTFLNQAKEFEQDVVLKRYVAPMKKALSALQSQQFDEVAAISFAKAEAEIMAAEQTIRANTRDIAVIKQAVAQSKFELEHVKSVALEVKKLASVKSDEFEPAVLDFESKLLLLSQAVDNSDHRDKALRTQAENILTGITALQQELETAKLSHSESVNQLGDENRALKLALQQKEVAVQLAESEKQNLSKQLEQTVSHVESLEALIDVYKQQLLAIQQEKTVEEVADAKKVDTPQQEAVADTSEAIPADANTAEQAVEAVVEPEVRDNAA